MKSLLLTTAAALSLSSAAFAQSVTAPVGATASTSVNAGVASPAASTSGGATASMGAAAMPGANATAPTTTGGEASTGAAATSAAAPATAATTTAAATFTDDEVSKVAVIASETRRLNAEGQAKIAAATTPETKAAATAQLQASLQGAVTKQGITVERYNELARASATDPALMARLSSATAAAQGTSSPTSATVPQ